MEVTLRNKPAIISWSYFMNKHTNRIVAKCVLFRHFVKRTSEGKPLRLTIPIHQVFVEEKSTSRNVIRKKALTQLLREANYPKEERRMIWEQYKQMRNGHW